jgi:hypothetical protein
MIALLAQAVILDNEISTPREKESEDNEIDHFITS